MLRGLVNLQCRSTAATASDGVVSCITAPDGAVSVTTAPDGVVSVTTAPDGAALYPLPQLLSALHHVSQSWMFGESQGEGRTRFTPHARMGRFASSRNPGWPRPLVGGKHKWCVGRWFAFASAPAFASAFAPQAAAFAFAPFAFAFAPAPAALRLRLRLLLLRLRLRLLPLLLRLLPWLVPMGLRQPCFRRFKELPIWGEVGPTFAPPSLSARNALVQSLRLSAKPN